MEGFKILGELNEFNNSGFREVFGNTKIQLTENPFEENTFESLKFYARPHEVFKLDWKKYTSLDFADRFLPYIKNGYKAKGVWMYDGAALFKDLKMTERKLFIFDDSKYLISLVNYTYPKGVLAGERNNLVQVNDNEVLSFIEMDEDNSINVSFKFGEKFKAYLTTALEDSQEKTTSTILENTTYKTDVKTFKNFFNDQLVHDTMMRFILNTLGIEKEATKLATYNALFTKEVLSFMDNFTIGGKYKPYVFIEKTQQNVLSKISENGVYPSDNEIFIWLVYEDYSFIKVQVGKTIAKDLKEKEILQEDIDQLILNEIKAEFENNIYSKRKINSATHRGIGDALIQLWLLEKVESSEINKEVFKANPALFLAFQATEFTLASIEEYKFKEANWNPKSANYLPFIEGNTIYNAQVCGFVNGIIDEVKAIPEMFAFFTKIFSSEKEKNEFLDGLKKLFDEGILQAILENTTKEYEKALQEGNVARLYYNLAHDSIQIVSLLIGVFQLAKGVASFINFTKKGFQYIKRYGRKGIDDLKLLKKSEIEEVFDDLDKVGKNIDSVRLKRLELDEWKKVIVKKGGQIKNVNKSKKLLKYFEVEDVGAAFDGFEIPPTIWIRDGATDLELFHETMHFEDFLRRGKRNFERGFIREEFPIGNQSQVPKRDQIINNYIKEKYVFDKILEEQETWIKKFGKGRFTQNEIDFSTKYFSEYQIDCILNGIDVKKIKLKK